MKKLILVLVCVLSPYAWADQWVNSHLHWQDNYNPEVVFRQLEDAGVVGANQGSKAREVLIPDEMSLEHFLDNLD